MARSTHPCHKHDSHTGWDRPRHQGAAAASGVSGRGGRSVLIGAGDEDGREPRGRHRLVVVLVLVAGLLAAARPVGAEPTTDQLRDAALTPEELGPEFGVRAEGPPGPGGGWAQIMTRTSPDLVVVSTTLQVWPDDELRHVADAYLSGLRGHRGNTGFKTPDPTTPADFPDGSLAYVFTGSINGQAMTGSLIVWRTAEVVALVGVLTDRGDEETVGAAVREYARLQRDKLAGAVGGATPAAP